MEESVGAVRLMNGARAGLRQRNVNWDSPIKVQFEIGNQPMPSVGTIENPVAVAAVVDHQQRQRGGGRRRRVCKGDDDGFESLNGKSSSGDDGSLVEEEALTEEVEDVNPGNATMEQQPKMVKPPCAAKAKGDHSDTDEEREDEMDLNLSSPGRNSSGAFTEGTNSNAEWCGVTTNSEECSYSSDMEHTDSQDFAPTVILNSNCGAMDRSEWMMEFMRG